VGSVNTLFLRGGESRYTKVLIDGVAVNQAGGFFDFSHLTTDNIERIEIVRGPASVVYGADAVTGIVQIFTRQGRGGFNGEADARAGTYDTREITLDGNGGNSKARYSLGGGLRRTDGNLKFNNQYYNGTLSASAGVTPTPGTDALLTARYTAAEFHYPTDYTGAPVDSASYRVQHRLTVGLDAKAKLNERATAKVQLGTNEVSDLTEDILNPGSLKSSDLSRGKRRSAEADMMFSLPQSSSLDIGAEYMTEDERSANTSAPVGIHGSPVPTFDASRHNVGIFSEIVATSEQGSSWTLAARRDDNSDFEAFTTYRAGASVPLGQSSRLRASISTAFNAPAFNQIRPTLYTLGSPDLKPERSRSWDVGIEQSLVYGILRMSVGYFGQRFSDLIQYVDGGPPDFLGSYANLTEAQSNGYEAELTLTPVSAWSASASYTVAKPHVTKLSSDYAGSLSVGDPLIRRPKQSGAASVTWSRPGSGNVSLMASYVGERPDQDFTQFPSPVVTLPAYTKIDFAAGHDFVRSASGRSSMGLTLRVDNVLDRRYEDVLNFPAPGRTFLVGARIRGAM
jgi:vitamin B12 transporter